LPPQTEEHEELCFAAKEEDIPRSDDILRVDAQRRAALNIGVMEVMPAEENDMEMKMIGTHLTGGSVLTSVRLYFGDGVSVKELLALFKRGRSHPMCILPISNSIMLDPSLTKMIRSQHRHRSHNGVLSL
jgi:hypothetical protein